MILSPADCLTNWGGRHLIEWLQAWPSHRRKRLLAAACCRQVWHLVPEGPPRLAVEAVEAYADGKISARKLRPAHRAAQAVSLGLREELRATG